MYIIGKYFFIKYIHILYIYLYIHINVSPFFCYVSPHFLCWFGIFFYLVSYQGSFRKPHIIPLFRDNATVWERTPLPPQQHTVFQCRQRLQNGTWQSMLVLELQLNQSTVMETPCAQEVCRLKYNKSSITTSDSGTWRCVLKDNRTGEAIAVSENVTLIVRSKQSLEHFPVLFLQFFSWTRKFV